MEGTAKKRGKNDVRWARNGLKKVGPMTEQPQTQSTTPGVIQNASATIWAAPRFEGPWSLVGLQPGFHAGEMPTLFPLPPLYRGTRAEGDALPTHVRKRGPGSRADPARNMVQLGNYVDGAPGKVGKWTALTLSLIHI